MSIAKRRRVRLVICVAAGSLAAAGLAGCGDEPAVQKAAKSGDQATSGIAAPPAAAALPEPVAAKAPGSSQVDENAALAARVIAALQHDPGLG
jgi:hypothetical protein